MKKDYRKHDKVLKFREDSKSYYTWLKGCDGKYWKFSLGTNDKEIAKIRYSELYKFVSLGATKKEIREKLWWIHKPKQSDEPKCITLLEFWEKKLKEYWESRKKSFESFYKKCMKNLLEYFGEKKLSEITGDVLRDYQCLRIKKVKPATVNREMAVLRRAFNLGIKWDVVSNNPVVGIEKYKEPRGRIRYLEIEEINRLLDACADWLKPIVLLALHTGMRISEMLNLTWKDVDFKTGLILLNRTKNDEPRDVPMTETVRQMMLEKKESSDSKYVFTTSNETLYGYNNVRRAFRIALKKVGIDNFRIHDLRHTFASQFMMSGGELYTLSKILGHKSITTTTIYAHLASHYKRVAIMSFEQHLNKKEPESMQEISQVFPNEANLGIKIHNEKNQFAKTA